MSVGKVKVPDGYRCERFGSPIAGEWYLTRKGELKRVASNFELDPDFYMFVEPVEPASRSKAARTPRNGTQNGH
jgi:hypothetical protein